MNSVKYEHEERAKRRHDFLRQVPEPDDVFLAAARAALVSAGLGELVEVLHPETIGTGHTPSGYRHT